MKNICFFYPSHKIGGAQLLFSRLGLELANNHSKEYIITFIDYENGFYRQFFNSKNVSINFIDYKNKEPFEIADVTDIICPLSYFFKIKEITLTNKEAKVFFWDLHPYNIISTSDYFGIFYKYFNEKTLLKLYPLLEPLRLKKNKLFLSDLIINKGVKFMCRDNMLFNKSLFSFEEQNNYLPIFLPNPEKDLKKRKKINLKERIHFCWLGRIDDDKYQLLEKFIKDVVHLNIRTTIHIIGNGNRLTNVINFTSRIKSIDFNFVGVLSGTNLTDYLIQEIDILFGVGTSVLESGSLGIPSIFGVAPNYNGKKSGYSWMYNVAGKNVTANVNNNNNLKLLIDDIYKENDIGLKCKKYFFKNHSKTNVINLFLDNIKHNSFTLTQAQKHKVHKLSLIEKIILFSKTLLKRVFHEKK